ncbi:MAG: DUF411 domain-containing protein, partial [Thiohalomonadales bacterium]
MLNKIVILISIVVFNITTVIATEIAPKITVYKSPTCGCCKKWVSHLKQNGFDVSTHDVNSVVPYKEKNNVEPRLYSCHTATIKGYVIEGHVPAKDILRLLKNRPAITGLSVPGMPKGSPGMEMGDKKDPYSVISFDREGVKKIYSQ